MTPYDPEASPILNMAQTALPVQRSHIREHRVWQQPARCRSRPGQEPRNCFVKFAGRDLASAALSELPGIKKIIVRDPAACPAGDRYMTWADLVALGRERFAAEPGQVIARVAAIKPDDPLALLYTITKLSRATCRPFRRPFRLPRAARSQAHRRSSRAGRLPTLAEAVTGGLPPDPAGRAHSEPAARTHPFGKKDLN